jgi:LacI family transcriptional regulator
MDAAKLEDVAREAGVSLATASRVVNGSSRVVAEPYRQRVLDAAAKLDYRPNRTAQAVARGTSNTVTLVVSDISDPFFSAIAAGVARAASAADLVVTIAITERDPDKEAELVRSLRELRPRVMILTGSRFTTAHPLLEKELRGYAEQGGRVVVLGRNSLPYSSLDLRNAEAAEALGRALADRGYRRFLVLAGRHDIVTSYDRAEGFARGAGGEMTTVFGEFSREGAYRAVMGLDPEVLGRIDLIFAVSDVMAVGAIAALRERGIAVPGQVAVAGFDDIAVARDVTPPLTTVHLPLEMVGEAAVDLALGRNAPAIEWKLEIRGSTPAR